MEFLIEQMKSAIEDQDFDRYYENNLAFHAVYLELSENTELLRTIGMLRERLFEFPKSKTFNKECPSCQRKLAEDERTGLEPRAETVYLGPRGRRRHTPEEQARYLDRLRKAHAAIDRARDEYVPPRNPPKL